jgi:hypothetical protein
MSAIVAGQAEPGQDPAAGWARRRGRCSFGRHGPASFPIGALRGQPNLRQVHLICAELHNELKARGFAVSPGQMGENVTGLLPSDSALPTRPIKLGAYERTRDSL